jgi:hypothetical protein
VAERPEELGRSERRDGGRLGVRRLPSVLPSGARCRVAVAGVKLRQLLGGRMLSLPPRASMGP